MAERPGPFCDGVVLDERGNSFPCAKRPHVGPHVAIDPGTSGVVWSDVHAGNGERVMLARPPEGWAEERVVEVIVPRPRDPVNDRARAIDATTATTVRALARGEARARGFTGDACTTCGGLRMQRSGACAVCADCGTSGGCS